MKRRIEEASDEPTAPFWMTTYGDMVTLLLTFFILMVSYANMDERKWAVAAKSLQGALGVIEDIDVEMAITQEAAGGEEDLLVRSEINKKLKEFEVQIAAEIAAGDITVNYIKNGLLIQMGSKLLFNSGSAELKQESFPVLKLISTTVKEYAVDIVVGGHTDNVPINSPRFHSNWELSGARAMTVVNYLMDSEGIMPQVLAATAYGENRPLVPNDTPEDRQVNRRVEFAITWGDPDAEY